MDWLVTGSRGGKPGRWKLEAADESAARQKAVAGGVAVQDVRRYPAAQVAAAPPAATAEQPSVISPEPSDPEPASESPDEEAPVDPGYRVPIEEQANPELASDTDPGKTPVEEEPPVATPASNQGPQEPAATSAQVATKPQKSLWGMAAIGAGVLAAVAGFIPSVHAASIPLASAGLLLAIAGIYVTVKRNRSGLLLPVIGAIICAAASGLMLVGLHNNHQGREGALTPQEREDQARADRVARANIQVQFISIRPADSGKYILTFTYKCLVSGMLVPQLNGRLRISDASGKEIETLGIFELFPQGLGTDPVRREDRWTLTPAVVLVLQGDASQLKVEFDPLN